MHQHKKDGNLQRALNTTLRQIVKGCSLGNIKTGMVLKDCPAGGRKQLPATNLAANKARPTAKPSLRRELDQP
eukprot:4031660-Amphidinium_carterae.1